MMQARLPILPDGTNNPASRPKISAARDCKPVNRRIFQINVVAYFSLRHGPAHGRRWLGYGVATEIDNLVIHTSISPTLTVLRFLESFLLEATASRKHGRYSRFAAT